MCWGEAVRRAEIEAQNRFMLERQRQFRTAADLVTEAWMTFPEVRAVAVIGSVAKALWREIPRFPEFRRAGIEVWHECKDLDLALWVDSQHRLGELRRGGALALGKAYESGAGVSIADHQMDVFMFEPESDRYLGRLPKGKRDCLRPGCGATPFKERVPEFEPHADLLAPVREAMLYQRGTGMLRSALDLPTVTGGHAPPRRQR